MRLSLTARISLGYLVLVALAAVLVPALLPESYGRPSAAQFLPPLTDGHLLGTDLNGRDLLHRVFTGARISLLVGLAGAIVALFVGTTVGVLAGYLGGRVDSLLMRGVDTFYAVPRLIFILLFTYAVESPLRLWMFVHLTGTWLEPLVEYSKIVILICTLGLIEWLTMARIVRGQVLALKEQQFVVAARALGQTRWRIVWRHLLPNLAGIIVVYLTLTIPAVMLDESFLSFLGLGVDASQASWGTLLSDAASVINPLNSRWWLLVFPALLMSSTLLAFNFLGDGLRDAFDPRGAAGERR
ncbi:MAG: ABC transporter permease [Verrucomicrobia bacterium]|nr:ABC transporter permease [Verrucomicrobiota bacterium]